MTGHKKSYPNPILFVKRLRYFSKQLLNHNETLKVDLEETKSKLETLKTESTTQIDQLEKEVHNLNLRIVSASQVD